MPIVIVEHPCSHSGSPRFEVGEAGSALSSLLCFFSFLFFFPPLKPQVYNLGWKQSLQKWWGNLAGIDRPSQNLCCTGTRGREVVLALAKDALWFDCWVYFLFWMTWTGVGSACVTTKCQCNGCRRVKEQLSSRAGF